MDAHKPVTLEEGDRYPLGPPNLHSGRLVARTPAFQVGEAGSKPVRSTMLSRGVRVDEGLISRIRSFEYFPRNQVYATVVLWVGHLIVYQI
jgi:hypothetical protein